MDNQLQIINLDNNAYGVSKNTHFAFVFWLRFNPEFYYRYSKLLLNVYRFKRFILITILVVLFIRFCVQPCIRSYFR